MVQRVATSTLKVVSFFLVLKLESSKFVSCENIFGAFFFPKMAAKIQVGRRKHEKVVILGTLYRA